MLGGVLAVLMGSAGFISVQGLRDDGVTTEAEVVNITRIKSAVSYSLRYVLKDGSELTCSTEDVLGEPAEGDRIQVLYERGYADVNCQSADYGTGFGEPITFTAAGSAMIVAAGGFYLLQRSKAA